MMWDTRLVSIILMWDTRLVPIILTSTSEIEIQTLVLLISAVLSMATLPGNSLRSWQLQQLVGGGKATCGSVRHWLFQWCWERLGTVHAGIARVAGHHCRSLQLAAVAENSTCWIQSDLA